MRVAEPTNGVVCDLGFYGERFMSRPHAVDRLPHKQLRVKELHKNLNQVIAKAEVILDRQECGNSLLAVSNVSG